MPVDKDAHESRFTTRPLQKILQNKDRVEHYANVFRIVHLLVDMCYVEQC